MGYQFGDGWFIARRWDFSGSPSAARPVGLVDWSLASGRCETQRKNPISQDLLGDDLPACLPYPGAATMTCMACRCAACRHPVHSAHELLPLILPEWGTVQRLSIEYYSVHAESKDAVPRSEKEARQCNQVM
jgi:hypothetical protein